MIINGVDYDKRIAHLTGRGIDWQADDDAPLGPVVYCNQHLRVHPTGWCTVSLIEKWPPGEEGQWIEDPKAREAATTAVARWREREETDRG